MFDAFTSYSGIFLFFIFTTLFGVIYQFVLRSWFYFNDRNVKFVRGVPLLGSTYKSVIGLEPAAISYRRLYEHFPKEKFVGIYDFGGRPSYLVRDPDLIKQLIVTDNNKFISNKLAIKNENDFFAQTLFGMGGSKWCGMEYHMNLLFSAGQTQLMHESMVKNTEEFIETLKRTDKIAKIFDSCDLFTRYASDIIAKTAFGIEINSLNDIDNEFYNASAALNEYRYVDGLKFLASLNFPSIVKMLDAVVGEEKYFGSLQNILEKSIESRKNKKSDQHDIIDLLIQAQSGQLEYSDDKVVNGKFKNCSDDDLILQSLAFYLGALSQVSQISCFMFHELALNPDIQDKLFVEVNSVKNELNGSPFTYETIAKLKYLDMVLCETLRRWCPVPFLERTCEQPYILETNDGKQIELQPGDGIFVPTYALHMDDKYFPKPMKFNPERFSDENRGTIRSGAFLPGIDTQDSARSRFTVMTIKTLAFHLLSEFFIDKSYKTPDPLKLKALPKMDAERGFFIELRRRNPDRSPYKSQVFT